MAGSGMEKADGFRSLFKRLPQPSLGSKPLRDVVCDVSGDEVAEIDVGTPAEESV